MNYYVPDQPLDPPDEPAPRRAHTCELCGCTIYEGEDYYDIPSTGICCEACIDNCKRYDAEAAYEGSYEEHQDFLYKEAREEALLGE